ncbi:Isochorismatase-like protein [Kockovaella imperatae]|uniref:nicotinamidase n=1 Tax=Kockovaella imperatae TaxID=4999 RepID=A0A1Y1UUI9_9TREE|nr:Isochorismatase-like protein [Kockovaella imperatae]ORX41136.1 Isochorismatase-like protein [Kockovaella imperatae]
MNKTALVIVDFQNDFLPPDGSLAVNQGRDVLPVLKRLLDRSEWDWAAVLASQDYHPRGHISFASTHGEDAFSSKRVTNAHGLEYDQILWPDHCVIGTKGAEIDQDLRQDFPAWDDRMTIVRKGQYSGLEEYSAFDGEINDLLHPKDKPPSSDGSDLPKGLGPSDKQVAKHLRDKSIENVVVVGLATDFCVLHTAMASLEAGFKTCVLAPAVRGIKEEDIDKAFETINSSGGDVVGKEDEASWRDELKRWTSS